ncbi:hypothetical protein ABZS66_22610 [Dactylosporangium sp. NPDC005572]|uniref:hypothetical protein n=1 Tax=Dactylosporangium sp. NPDC005572 TaxID=3156889 RepID=UPI0033A01AC5
MRECGHGCAVALEGDALFVGEVELLKHSIDPVFDGQELAGVGLFGQVEAALGAGESVSALGEEVVAAVAVAEVVVLPRLFATGGGAGEDGLAVDEDLNGADIAGEVVGLAVGGAEGALRDLAVVAGAGSVFVAEPLLQVGERERLAGVEQLGGDGGAGPVAGECAAGVGFGDVGLAAERRDDPVSLTVEVGLADQLAAPGEQVLTWLTCLAVGQVRLGWADQLPGVDELPDDWVDRFGGGVGGLVRGNP